LANPGCYPTAAQLPLVPLLKAGLITPEDIIIDAKSGTTGAGRAPKEAFLYCEVADGIAAYAVGSHRHAPEIEQQLTAVVVCMCNIYIREIYIYIYICIYVYVNIHI
jgi:N-acetyl-gamma-glutamyl-phosphate reductase